MDIQLLIVIAVLAIAVAYLVRRYWRSIKRGKCNCDCDCNASKCRCHGGNLCQGPPFGHGLGHGQLLRNDRDAHP